MKLLVPFQSLTEVVGNEASSVSELFYAVQALMALGQKKVDSAKLIKTLQAALKKDDSILKWVLTFFSFFISKITLGIFLCTFSVHSLGYSFHIAAQLGAVGTFAFDRIEDAIVQADEVDSRYLQFEGGLSITGEYQ